MTTPFPMSSLSLGDRDHGDEAGCGGQGGGQVSQAEDQGEGVLGWASVGSEET